MIRYTFLVKSGLPNRYKIRFGICPMRTLKSPREASLSIYSYNTLIFCAVARSDGLSRKVVSTVPVKEYYEDAAWRLLIVASLIMNPALLRKESRGGHYREDFPHADESYEVHSIQQMGKEITTAPVNKDYLNF